MPALLRLVISGIRNIRAEELDFTSGLNCIIGPNGSGKTSLLEAIHLLSLGRTFRSHQQTPLISDSMETATVFGETAGGQSLGVARPRKGPATFRINGKPAGQLAELTLELPVQLLNSDTFKILEGGPRERRAFLDWGVFHVKHEFLDAWKQTRRALQNRNALLKQGGADAEVSAWTHEFLLHAKRMHELRLDYLQLVQEALAGPAGDELRDLFGEAITVDYRRGWDPDQGLAEQLARNLDRERRQGHTLYGPHRADLLFQVANKPCAEALSRGQLKLLVTTMKAIQAEILLRETGKTCLFLVDDLPAELDQENQARVCRLLLRNPHQLFITAIDDQVVRALPPELKEYKLFHVKHGKIAAVKTGANIPLNS